MAHTRTLAPALLLVTALAADAAAQRIIYDGKSDQTAQQAVTAAGQVTSDALFDLMPVSYTHLTLPTILRV